MRTIKLTDAALNDLKEIWEYIGQNNRVAAAKVIEHIIKKFALIRDFPEVGREQNKLLMNMRSLVVNQYIIFYMSFEDRIDVIRVLRSSRQIELVFESFFESL
jgi:toxin ParE1/3/4